MNEKEYSVSEAVRLIGVESHVLRYWEEELQIAIRRTSQGHRIYSQKDVDTFCRVKKLKESGLQLKAIRLLLDRSGSLEQGSLTEEDMEIEVQIRALADEELGDAKQEAPETSRDSAENADMPLDVENQKCSGKTEEETETQGESDYEIVPVGGSRDYLEEFEGILRKLIEEAIAEQNEKLERAVVASVRDELEDFYLQVCQIMQEAAVTRPKPMQENRIKQLLRRLFSGKK